VPEVEAIDSVESELVIPGQPTYLPRGQIQNTDAAQIVRYE